MSARELLLLAAVVNLPMTARGADASTALASLRLPPDCPFMTRAEAEALLGGKLMDTNVMARERAPEMRMFITTCGFTAAKRSLMITLSEFDSPAATQLVTRQIAEDDRKDAERLKQEREDSIAWEKENAGDENSHTAMTEEERELYGVPKRVHERETLGGVGADFAAKPHEGSAGYSAVKGRNAISVAVMWRGKPSEMTVMRPMVRSAFTTAIKRMP